jgi:hypothetical protein
MSEDGVHIRLVGVGDTLLAERKTSYTKEIRQ